MRQKLLSISQSLRLPSICALCHQFHKNSLAVCSFCMGLLKYLGPACPQCACPLPEESNQSLAIPALCGQCIKKPPHFDKAIIAYSFEEPLRSLLHQFKYHNGLYLSGLLCELMMHALKQIPSQAQCLIPIPMHPKKLKLRGFNQAALLAQRLARNLNLPFDLHSCQKVLNTAPQAGLDGEHRLTNLHKAFLVLPLPYEHVVLIDDLLTTGSTANELALGLKKVGVKKVDIWCCARTVIKSK